MWVCCQRHVLQLLVPCLIDWHNNRNQLPKRDALYISDKDSTHVPQHVLVFVIDRRVLVCDSCSGAFILVCSEKEPDTTVRQPIEPCHVVPPHHPGNRVPYVAIHHLRRRQAFCVLQPDPKYDDIGMDYPGYLSWLVKQYMCLPRKKDLSDVYTGRSMHRLVLNWAVCIQTEQWTWKHCQLLACWIGKTEQGGKCATV